MKNLINRKYLMTFLLLCMSTFVCAQSSGKAPRFKGVFHNKEHNIYLHLDLYEPSLLVGGYEFLGKVNGYMHEGIYGIWLISSHEISKKQSNKAKFNLVSDLGADGQNVEAEMSSDTVLVCNFVDGVEIKKVVDKKLVKLPSTLTFKKIMN